MTKETFRKADDIMYKLGQITHWKHTIEKGEKSIINHWALEALRETGIEMPDVTEIPDLFLRKLNEKEAELAKELESL